MPDITSDHDVLHLGVSELEFHLGAAGSVSAFNGGRVPSLVVRVNEKSRPGGVPVFAFHEEVSVIVSVKRVFGSTLLSELTKDIISEQRRSSSVVTSVSF